MNLELNIIGSVDIKEGYKIIVKKEYREALKGLKGFSHLMILFWFHKVEQRNILTTKKPYAKGPNELGIFATRAPFRPNPIGLETVAILNIDYENGIIYIPYIDAFDQTPILDIKPYTPSIDKVENPRVPEWCEDWPKSYEASGEFDWGKVFNF